MISGLYFKVYCFAGFLYSSSFLRRINTPAAAAHTAIIQNDVVPLTPVGGFNVFVIVSPSIDVEYPLTGSSVTVNLTSLVPTIFVTSSLLPP